MLPFSKRKNQSEEVELGEDDFELVELVELAPGIPRDAELARTLSRPSRPSRPRMILPVSRRILDEDVEEDVAGQCLASIAAETARDGGDAASSGSSGSSGSSAAAAAHANAHAYGSSAPLVPAMPPFAPPTASSTSRLPSVSAPPVFRTTRTNNVAPRGFAEAPGVRDSSPPPAFIRRSSPVLPASIPAAAPSSYVAVAAAAIAAGGNAGSVAPVSMPMTQRPNEPTVIVVRERPRAAWIFAAAAIGALGALGATHLLGVPPVAPTPVAAAPLAAAPPSTVVVAPLAVAPPSSPSVVVAPATPVASDVVDPARVAARASAAASVAVAPSAPAPAIVHFGDDQGVAIKSPAPRRPAPPAPATTTAPAAAPVRSTGPRAPSMGPALPDGSFGLGRSDTAASSSVATPAPPLTASVFAPAPEPPRKHALTPEQQLAAAQLKASMK